MQGDNRSELQTTRRNHDQLSILEGRILSHYSSHRQVQRLVDVD